MIKKDENAYAFAKLKKSKNYQKRVTAGRGLEKLSRGRKKFLTSGWTLKFAYAPHIQDLTSGWKSFGPYAKHMPRALSETTIKFTSGHQSLVDAYAQHQLSIKKYRWTTKASTLKIAVG